MIISVPPVRWGCRFAKVDGADHKHIVICEMSLAEREDLPLNTEWASDLEGFGSVDWHRTLRNPRFLDDPDRYVVRVPGFVLIGGRISLDTALAPDEYARRFELFRLPEYERVFESLVSDRRCAHCARRLQPKKGPSSLYCSSNCSAASRQKRHREKTKASILRFRGDERP